MYSFSCVRSTSNVEGISSRPNYLGEHYGVGHCQNRETRVPSRESARHASWRLEQGHKPSAGKSLVMNPCIFTSRSCKELALAPIFNMVKATLSSSTVSGRTAAATIWSKCLAASVSDMAQKICICLIQSIRQPVAVDLFVVFVFHLLQVFQNEAQPQIRFAVALVFQRFHNRTMQTLFWSDSLLNSDSKYSTPYSRNGWPPTRGRQWNRQSKICSTRNRETCFQNLDLTCWWRINFCSDVNWESIIARKASR